MLLWFEKKKKTKQNKVKWLKKKNKQTNNKNTE